MAAIKVASACSYLISPITRSPATRITLRTMKTPSLVSASLPIASTKTSPTLAQKQAFLMRSLASLALSLGDVFNYPAVGGSLWSSVLWAGLRDIPPMRCLEERLKKDDEMKRLFRHSLFCYLSYATR